jgi:hypothetical protein
MTMKREDAIRYVGHAVDDALSPRTERGAAIPANARLVGWQCGFEPMFVAVWSYLGVEMAFDDAEEIAADYLEEINWFSNGRVPADYVL